MSFGTLAERTGFYSQNKNINANHRIETLQRLRQAIRLKRVEMLSHENQTLQRNCIPAEYSWNNRDGLGNS